MTGVTGTVESAEIRLVVSNPSDSGGTMSGVSDSSWLESGITWSNKPPIDGSALSTVGSASAGQTVTFDVTQWITGNGTFSVAIATLSTNGVDYRSRDASSGNPVLEVNFSTTLNTPPVADPGGPYVGTEDIPVAFDGSASSDLDGDPLTYAWDFGDGNNGTGVAPNHTYDVGGTFTVTLVVNDGTVDSPPVATTATITDVNDTPVADPGGPYAGTEDIPLAFDGSGSSDFDGDPLTYAWDFGDGNNGTGVSPSHTYLAGGVYTATLVVNDGTVDSLPVATTATITDVNDTPVADPGGPYAGTEDIPLAFDGSGSSDFDGDPLTYAWDFGDGNNGTGVSPSHTYVAGGVYTATLVVNDGTVDSLPVATTATITDVNDTPAADPGGPYAGTEDVPLAFDGDPLTYAWDFGDTSTGTGVNPSHTYLAGGVYTVTLTVNDGTVDSLPVATTATIGDVNDQPVADPGGPYAGTEDLPVAFDGSGSSDFDGDLLTYAWDFGDTNTGTGVAPSHTYLAGGVYNVTLTVNDGTVDSLPVATTATITDVNDTPVADPGGPYAGTEDVPLAFDGSASSDFDGDPLTYAWDFGDGNNGTGVNPSHTYLAGGVYTVTLTVNDGTVDSLPVATTATIGDVNDQPVADPGGPYAGTEDVPLAFDGSGSSDLDGDPLTYAWDFGDGNNGTGVSSSHTYLAGGVYTVTLTVNDGTVDSLPVATTATITDVNDTPVADPGGPYAGTEDVPLAFDGSASSDFDGDPLTYTWDFGDGNNGTGVAPNHTYTLAGTYEVSLVVHDGFVSSSPATTTATISETNDPPVADPGGPYNGTEDVPLAFDGSGSSDLDGDPLTYAWDFGDGNNGTGVTPSHTYLAGGVYNVTLVVNDGTVDSLPVATTATITDVNDTPVADPGGPYAGTEDVPLAFDGSASSDFDGDPLTYAWDFGDGNNGTGSTPSHTYLAGGVYIVTLTVNDGTVDSLPVATTATVTDVNDTPVADSGGPYVGTEDVPLAFDGSGSSDLDGDPLTYAWDFGDGNNGTGVTPSHTYLAGGVYNVTLTVNDGTVDSLPAATTATVTDVNDTPVADPGGPYAGTEDVPLAFDGSGSSDFDGDPLTYAWDFGDGNNSTGVTPSHTYLAGGVYNVALTVNDGTVDSLPVATTATVTDVNDIPVADPGGPYAGTEDVPLAFDGSASSDFDGDPLTYAWDFGDGNNGTGVTPSHTYLAGGVYNVTLTVNDGTVDSLPVATTATVADVNDQPVADPGGPYAGTTGVAVEFDGSGSSDFDGDPLTYAWDFGDGNSGTGVTPSHPYAAAGDYIVALVVNDGTEDSLPVTTTATITDVTNNPPSADPGGPYMGTVGVPLTFDGSGSFDLDGDPLTYAWDFGDTNTGTGVGPTHTYTTSGVFTVTLVVNDGTVDSSPASTTATIGSVFEARVGTSKDDAEEASTGSVTYTSSDLEFMQDGADVQAYVGMRWTNVAVPQGATVLKAYLELTTDEKGSEPADVTFYAEDEDDAATFSSASFDISTRAKTSAYVTWSNVPAWNTIGEVHQTPDVAAIIQKVVDRPTWASGNAIAILAAPASANDGPRTAESYNGSSSAAPLLHIEWVVGPDMLPPQRSNPQPTGPLPFGTTQTDISLDTHEDSTCRHDTIAGTDYASMPNTFSITGGTSHTDTVTGLIVGTNTFYVRCADQAGNENTDDFQISFDVSDGSITTFEVRVNTSKDDSEESSGGSVTFTSSDLEFMQDGADVQAFVGMRWTNVTVPQGATIVNAYVELTADEKGSEPADVLFYAEASDSALTFSNSALDLSSRSTTTASAIWASIPAWNTVGETHQTSDLAAIIQEVVDRPLWLSGNALVILATTASANDGPRTAESYNGSSTKAPLLHIEYQ